MCHSMPRHRILVTWLKEHIDDIKKRSILYFAQERSVRCWMDANNLRYTTADLYLNADLKLDIEDTGLPDESVQMIICNHVLEHVSDYRKALKELHRIIAPDGMIILSFPIDPTFDDVLEDASIVTEEGRRLTFGQNDHLRIFGKNAKSILESFGFHVTEIEGEKMSPVIKPVVGPADYDSNILYLLKP